MDKLFQFLTIINSSINILSLLINDPGIPWNSFEQDQNAFLNKTGFIVSKVQLD